MSDLTWPIRVGGEYSAVDDGDFIRRVTSIDGDMVFYVCYNKGYGTKGYITSGDAKFFRSVCMPEDASPIPELVFALEQALDRMQMLENAQKSGSSFTPMCEQAISVARAALAKAGAL